MSEAHSRSNYSGEAITPAETSSHLERVYTTAQNLIRAIHEGMQHVTSGKLSIEKPDDQGRIWEITMNDLDNPTSVHGKTLSGTPIPGFRDVSDAIFQATAISPTSAIVYYRDRRNNRAITMDPRTAGAKITELTHAFFPESTSGLNSTS